MSNVLTDSVLVFWCEMMLVLCDLFSVIFLIVQSLVFFGLFGPLFGGLVPSEVLGGQSVLQWFLFGVLVMICLFGTSTVGVNLLYEFMIGSYERIVVILLRRFLLLIGWVLKELAPLVVQAMLIMVVAIFFGFRLYLGHAAVGLLILGVFGVGIGVLSYSLGIVICKREWMFWGVQQSLIFLLLILFGMMLSITSGLGWMQVVAWFNPLSFIVDAEWVLFANATFDSAVLNGVLVVVFTCVVGLIVGVRQICRSTI